MESERRRSPRVGTNVWVAIDGADEELKLRNASVSATGLYFEYERPVGDPGTITWLFLASLDRVVSVQIMAAVVRDVVTRSEGGREIRGTAFEFMPESEEAIGQLRDFVHYVFALAAEGARASEAPPPAERHAAGIRSIVVEADRSFPIGTAMRVELIAKGAAGSLRVEGRAVHASPLGDGYHRIEIAVQKPMEGPLRRFSSPTMAAVRLKEQFDGPTRRFTPAYGIPFARGAAPTAEEKRENEALASEALEGLLGTLIELRAQPRPEPRHHLAGEISRIRLPALLSMIETDKMTGELALRRGAERFTLFVRRGQVFDVEPSPRAPLETLRTLLEWGDGEFAFTLKAVLKTDRVATKTADLLATFAREHDGARRRSKAPPAPT